MNKKMRKERDSFGEVEVPKDVYWGATTQRAIEFFQISGRVFPTAFIQALAMTKKACTRANVEIGNMETKKAQAIIAAIDEVIKGRLTEQFPVDVFQSGSGTQINMNMNEVLANRANEILGFPLGKKTRIHPNDDVNKSQSSNDVIPTAMHLSTLQSLDTKLYPALQLLRKTLRNKIRAFKGVIKVGRTHLQDAVPIRLSQEFEVYERQAGLNQNRLKNASKELCYIPLSGTVLGTGLGADKNFGACAVAHLRRITGFSFKLNPVKAEGIASHNSIVQISGDLRLLALSVLKMANDIRWMGSGPNAGLGELLLPSNEPGSSIMPGKTNPTQAESLIQACLKVIGNDVSVSLGEAFGSILDLNVAKPLMITDVLESIELLSNGITSFVEYCLKDLKANRPLIDSQLTKNLMLVTNLVPIIGYDKASEIARKAHRTGKTLKETIEEMGLKMDRSLVDELLDPSRMV